MSDRYAVFIDAGYLRQVMKAFPNRRIDYLRLSEACSFGQERLRTYYYDCAPFQDSPATEEQKKRKSNFDKFRFNLERLPRFQVRLGRLQRIIGPSGEETFSQKQVDIVLACDLLKLALEHQISRAVVLAGDSDFVPVIQIARDAGTVVQLYYHDPPRPHDELLSVCDERILITQDFLDKAKLENKG